MLHSWRGKWIISHAGNQSNEALNRGARLTDWYEGNKTTREGEGKKSEFPTSQLNHSKPNKLHTHTHTLAYVLRSVL